jgi:hypothetical protein
MVDSNVALELVGSLVAVPPGTSKPLAKYTYQRTRQGHGNIQADKTARQQVRIWTGTTNPRTSGQQQHRGLFALGVCAWRSLSEPEKNTWRIAARSTKLNSYQLFLKNFCLSGQPVPISSWASDWDGGKTMWDYGATHWRSLWDDGLTKFIEI